MHLGQPGDVILGRDARQLLVERLEHRAIEQRLGRDLRWRLGGKRRGGEQDDGGNGGAHARSLIPPAHLRRCMGREQDSHVCILSQVHVPMTPVAEARPTPLTPNQIRGFWAAWGGWALDGMDSFIYSLVLVPALTELLPQSGIPATPGNVGYYGSVLFALFLIGWGVSMIWGPIADRFGRVRTLMLTILCYSVFTLLCGLVTGIWQLAALRFLAGIGIGGEWAMGGTFIAEEWPEDRRKAGGGYMHTGYYFGFFLAALANYYIGANYGWRWMFVVGGTPALLIAFIRYGVRESDTWRRSAELGRGRR